MDLDLPPGRRASPPRRIRASVLAWILGFSIAALAVTFAVAIADFRHEAQVLSERVLLLDRVTSSRTLARAVVLTARRLYLDGDDTPQSLATIGAQLEARVERLRAAHRDVVGDPAASHRTELPTELAELYYGSGHELDRRVREYLDAARAVARDVANDAPRDRVVAGVADLTASARDLLDRYDEAAAACVALVRGRGDELRSTRYIQFLAVHLLLVAWIAFLYQSMLRRFREDSRRHSMSRVEAEEHSHKLAGALAELRRSRDEARQQSVAMLSVMEDLQSERVRLDREIAERTRAEERFRAVLDASPLAKLLVSPTGTIQLANPAVEPMFGYSQEELVGQPVEILVPDRWRSGHPENRARFEHERVARPMGAGRHLHARRKDGSALPVEIALNPIVTDQGPGVLASVLDLTQRERAERAVETANRELKRKNEELEQFVYTVSHDLKSPMVTISGFVGHIATDAQTAGHARILDAAKRVERACSRLRKTLDDLLDLSRAGRTVQEPKRVEVRELVNRALEQLASRIEAAGARLEVAPSLPMVEADPDRLGEVFDNLISNALRYGCVEPGSTIRIGGVRAGGEARFFVEDEGPGIPAEFHERVFGLFVRLSNAGDGTGVGLAIVKRIVEAHGGRAWVESPPAGRAHGTKTWVALPDPLVATWQRREARDLGDVG